MITKDKLKHHIKHLEEQHAELEDKIKLEFQHYGNDKVVTELKKQKLEIKDEISRMRVKINEITE